MIDPQYIGTLDIEIMVAGENDGSTEGNYQEMLNRAAKAIEDYVISRAIKMPSPTAQIAEDVQISTTHALTLEDIFLYSSSSVQTKDREKNLKSMAVILMSFRTPVDNVSEELTRLVKDACKTVKAPYISA